MAGYKETPRQKMIGMMYLVLTALLALNVSKEILSAFVVVNESLEVTNQNFGKKVDQSMDLFKKAYLAAPEKVGEKYKKAQQAQEYSKKMVEYINKLRFDLIEKVEGPGKGKIKLSEVGAKDNYDIPTTFFIGQNPNNCKAKDLKNEIEKFKKNMLALLDAKDTSKVRLGLATDGKYTNAEGASESWENHHFYNIVTAAVVVTLNKLIMETKNAEFDIINQLYSSVSADDFKFDQIGAKVVPKSTFVISGDSYEADIFVAAYDTKQKPTIIVGSDVDTITNTVIGGGEPVDVALGVGKYKVGASGSGEKKYGGIISIKTPSGGTKSYWFKGAYNVSPPAATVSAEATKAFYIGLDNPVSISVPGVAPENVMPTISGGGQLIKQPNGSYIVKNLVNGTRSCTITVSAKMGGSNKSMGVFPFKVKSVPDPVTTVAGKRGGGITKAQLQASPYVSAVMDNFIFDGVNYKVTGFLFSCTVNGMTADETCAGNMLSPKALSNLSKAKTGSKVFFDLVKVVGPSGARTIPGIILKLT